MNGLSRAGDSLVEVRRLGRTGHESSVAILGGSAFATATPEQTRGFFEYALERGVNHLDIAPSYGHASGALAQVLSEYRYRMFVSSKTLKTTANAVRIQMGMSLKKLGIDRFDLYQGHGLTSIEELDQRSGAMAEMFNARDSGVTSFVGLTAHGLGAPGLLLRALRRYDLDTVMFPLYPRAWADQAYRHDTRALLAECTDKDIGVMVTNAIARRPWGDREPTHKTWYEPQTTPYGIQRGVNFALSTDGVHVFCTPGDLALLEAVLDAADKFEPIRGGDYATAVVNMSREDLIFPVADDLERIE